ncbi:citryl-CoA lyase [Variovorax sp. ZT4R33]|uniref:citryl-CoA lyase n=1 Tax=Variovorax sp. ZT4R33 TaxID=3443743 RepID=UPI003F4609D9
MTKTRIGSHPNDTARLRVRGKDTLTELVGEVSFTDGFYLVVTGRMPTKTQRKVLDAALLVLMDHGLTPSALVARIVADSNPDDIQIPLAAGALMVGNKFAGTMVGTGRVLSEGMAAEGDKREWAKTVVSKSRETRRRIPGFGHPNYKGVDPRAARLFEVALSAGVKGDYISLLKILSEEIDADAGKQIVLNATGALGAILHEIDFPVEAMRSVSVVGRCAGLVGHVLEERSSPISPEIFALSETISYDETDD